MLQSFVFLFIFRLSLLRKGKILFYTLVECFKADISFTFTERVEQLKGFNDNMKSKNNKAVRTRKSISFIKYKYIKQSFHHNFHLLLFVLNKH